MHPANLRGMNTDYYSPAFKMIAREQDRLQAISENLANINMPGYRKLDVGDLTFDTLLQKSVDFYRDQMQDGRYDPVFIDFTEGPLMNTERPLDFAVHGEGFFVVQRNDENLYTRNGHFKVDADGTLQTMNGFPVQGVNGPIEIPPEVNHSELTAGDDGSIRDGQGNVLGTLRIARFDNVHRLGRAGTTLYRAPDDMPPRTADPDRTQVVHRTLEGGNTSIYEEMAEMISCLRAYEANQKMITSFDENETRMITALGGP